MMDTRRHRSSSPIKDHVDSSILNESKLTDTFLETGDETRSLLAPLYSDSFHSDEYKELPPSMYNEQQRNHCPDNNEIDDDTLDESLMSQSMSSIHSTNHASKSKPRDNKGLSNASSLSSLDETNLDAENETQNESGVEPTMTNVTWERWLLRKTIEDIDHFNLERAKRKDRAEAKKKLEEEKKERLRKSEKQREEWLKKKELEREEKIREKEEKLRGERSKKEEEKRMLEKKADENYRQWQVEKLKKEKEERKKKLEEKRKESEVTERKKSASQDSYKSWLEKSKNKRVNRSTYGYTNGNLMSYYDMGCSPSPSFTNPIPWVGVAPNDTKKYSKHEPIISPPLLWKQVEERNNASKPKSKPKRGVTKHSCIDRKR